VSIDAQRIEHAVGRARGLMAADAPERAALVLSHALTLWRGSVFAELDDWDPARVEAERLTELRSHQHRRVVLDPETTEVLLDHGDRARKRAEGGGFAFRVVRSG
jgi:hypothetical protein